MVHKSCMIVRGIKYFNCIVCGQHSANYANGVVICEPCCKRLNFCQICGKEIKINDEVKFNERK